jgi:hypothetical protein
MYQGNVKYPQQYPPQQMAVVQGGVVPPQQGYPTMQQQAPYNASGVSGLPLNGIGLCACCDWIDPATGLDPGCCTKLLHCICVPCIIGRSCTIARDDSECFCKISFVGWLFTLLQVLSGIIISASKFVSIANAIITVFTLLVFMRLHYQLSDKFHRPSRDLCTVCLCSWFCAPCESARLYHFALQEKVRMVAAAPAQQQMA